MAVSLLESTPYLARLLLPLAARLERGMPNAPGGADPRARRWLSRLRAGDAEPVYRQIAVLDRG